MGVLGYEIGMAHDIRCRLFRIAVAAVSVCAVIAGLGVAASTGVARPIVAFAGGHPSMVALPAGPAGAAGRAGAGVTAATLDGTEVAPFAPADGVEATVLLFVMTDCPISNRYAPEVRRLHEGFADGVRFWLVYVDAQRPVDELREHRASFGYPFGALRDVEGALVALAGATVTPEVAVFDASQRMIYRGRIDDRFVSFGVARRAPRTRDLHDRLSRIAAGETLAFSETLAVGCYIPGA